MTIYNTVLTSLIGTKLLTSTANRYIKNGPDGKKASTPARIIDDLDSLSTAGIVGMCILRLWSVWFK